jgi:glycosyltransferase involved in cell wall biosynthesis
MKVAVYAIALNESEFLERWYESAKEADCVLLADTGSIDDTVSEAEALGITVYRLKVSPWRFDDAKNTALNLLPFDIDVAVSLDMDEVLLPGWRARLEGLWSPGINIVHHRYRHNGGPWQWHSKIHARHGCKWTGAVHETLSWAEDGAESWDAEIYLDEWQDTKKNRRGYLDLLLKKIEEGDTDWRTFYFLANEYITSGDVNSAISTRCQSYAYCNDGPLTKSYIAKNIALNFVLQEDIESAKVWLGISYKQSQERETLYEIAKLYLSINEFEVAYKAANECLSILDRREGFTYSSEAWGAAPHDIAAVASYYLGKIDEALEHGEHALKLDPENQRLKTNMTWYEAANGA